MEFHDRTVLVIDSRPDAAVGLRDRIDPQRAIIRRVAPADLDLELDLELARIRPYPFAMVGVTRGGVVPVLSSMAAGLLATRPIPVIWWGVPPDAAVRARTCETWVAFRDAVVGLTMADWAGLTLSDHRGLTSGPRRLMSPALEGLLAAHPDAVPLSAAARAGVAAVISRAGIAIRVVRPGRGVASLEVSA